MKENLKFFLNNGTLILLFNLQIILLLVEQDLILKKKVAKDTKLFSLALKVAK